MITRAEAVALTELLRTIRPAWDALTTINVLMALTSHDLANIAAAGVRTAQDKTMRSPQSLAFLDSLHWKPTPASAHRIQDIAETEARIRVRQQAIAHCPYCDERGRMDNGFLCPHEDPTERAARVKAWADQVRAQIRPAPRPNQQETA